MSLYTLPPQWAYCTDNLPATPSTSATGTNVTCGASHSDGSSVTLLSTLGHDVEYIVLGFGASSSPSGVNNSCLVDLLVDRAGGTSWTPLINDLLAGFVGQTGTQNSLAQRCYRFPLWIPAGASLGLRGRTASASTFILRCNIWAYGGNRNPASWWCGQKVTTYGSTPASSIGTMHTAGNTGSYSSFATIGTSSTEHNAFTFGVQGVNGTTMSGLAYHFNFGIGGVPLGGTYYKQTTTSEAGWDVNPEPIFYSAPAGTALQIYGTCSGTAEALDVAIYGIS